MGHAIKLSLQEDKPVGKSPRSRCLPRLLLCAHVPESISRGTSGSGDRGRRT